MHLSLIREIPGIIRVYVQGSGPSIRGHEPQYKNETGRFIVHSPRSQIFSHGRLKPLGLAGEGLTGGGVVPFLR